MHAKDRSLGLQILHNLAEITDFNIIEKEKITDTLIEHMNRTNGRLYGLKNACETIKRVHLEFHHIIGTSFEDVPHLHDTNMPLPKVAEQSNSIIVRR